MTNSGAGHHTRFLNIVAAELGAMAIHDSKDRKSLEIAEHCAGQPVPWVDLDGRTGLVTVFGFNLMDTEHPFFRDRCKNINGEYWYLRVPDEAVDFTLHKGALPRQPPLNELTFE